MNEHNDLPPSSLEADGWREIAAAPKEAKRADGTTERILLLFSDGNQSVGYWDWYYAEGGRGYEDMHDAWIEPVSGEQLDRHYGRAIGWRPLPPRPEQAP